MRTWFVLVPIVLVFALGLHGLNAVDDGLGASAQLYRILQLFALEGDWTSEVGPLPWTLEAARFLAPVTTLASIVFVFATRTRIALDNAFARIGRGHVVAAGLSDRVWNFLLACRRSGTRVTVLAAQADEALVAETRRLGHRVIEVDRIDYTALMKAGVVRAGHLVVFTDEDGDNVEIALRAKRLLASHEKRRGGGALQIRLHLDDVGLAARLEDYPKFFTDARLAEVSFFNLEERTARLLFAEHPMELYADALGAIQVHLVVFGRGRLAEQIVLQTLRRAHYADGARPRVTFAGPTAPADLERFRRAHRAADEVGDLAALEVGDFGDDALAALAGVPLGDATGYVVAPDEDVAALREALGLRSAVLSGAGPNAPIFVAMREGHGLARLLESSSDEPELPDGIFPFGMLDEVLSQAQILDERQDRLARALHQDYLASLEQTGGASPERPSHRPWNLLPEVIRRENRTLADHLESKLRAVDRCLATVGRTPPLTEPEARRLAEMEQRRWCAVRRLAGWRAGTPRNDMEKVHDALVHFDELPETMRRRNVDTQHALVQTPNERLGLACPQVLVIGVVGHRPHRLPEDRRRLERAFVRTFESLRREFPHHEFVVVSPLAEGADRIGARLALDRFDARLHVPLPLPYELYLESFGLEAGGREASSIEFRELVGRAEYYYEMPLRFGTLAELAGSEGQERRARQYALAGAWLVQHAHELIGVWDGREADGEGGTAQVLAWRSEGVPEAYRFDGAFQADRGLALPWIIGTDVADDWRPVRASAVTD